MQASDTQTIRSKRPVFLWVLCILSWIWIGIGVFQGFTGLVQGPESKESLDLAMAELDENMASLEAEGTTGWTSTVEKIKYLTVTLNDHFYAYQTLSLLIYALGLYAVVQMFRGIKLGFHLYVIYSLLSVSDFYFFVSPSMIPTFIIVLSASVSGLFVLLYALNLKWMR